VDGVIVLDKPLGWTSHDAVAKVRKLAGTRRVGHLGTLDPIATGVLPLVVGRATRLAQFYLRSDKVYDAIIRFGYATDTYDSEGQPTTPITEPEIDRERLEQELARLRGTIRQMPPPISAKKVGGVPAYRLARKNIPVELKPVEVSIYSIELLDLNGPEARILVHCSAGTYLRTVAHDLGIAMGCGAHLKTLRRTATGEFTIERAHTIEELEELARQGRLKEAVIPMARLLPEFPFRNRGLGDRQPHPSRTRFSRVAFPRAPRFALRQSDHAGRRSHRHWRGALAEPVSPDHGFVASRRLRTQPSLITWRARPRASASEGTGSVITEPAPT
jgi:tRNA pseudouridine55 synthase